MHMSANNIFTTRLYFPHTKCRRKCGCTTRLQKAVGFSYLLLQPKVGALMCSWDSPITQNRLWELLPYVQAG